MGLIPKRWPPPERKLSVGGNWIIQQPFRGAMSRAMASDSQYTGHGQIELRDLSSIRDPASFCPRNVRHLQRRADRRARRDDHHPVKRI